MSVCKSADGGATWGTRRQIAAGYGACRAVAVAPSNNSVVYACGDENYYSSVYRSSNAGDTWTTVTNNLAALAGYGHYANALLVDSADPNRVFSATGGGVFLTANGGGSWSATGLALDTRALAYYPARSRLYAATYGQGVYVSDNGGSTWKETNSGLENKDCQCLALDPVNQYLFVGTGGGGVWRATLNDLKGSDVGKWELYR